MAPKPKIKNTPSVVLLTLTKGSVRRVLPSTMSDVIIDTPRTSSTTNVVSVRIDNELPTNHPLSGSINEQTSKPDILPLIYLVICIGCAFILYCVLYYAL